MLVQCPRLCALTGSASIQDFEGTKVGPEGGAAILRGVTGHSTLEALDLSSTGLGSQVGKPRKMCAWDATAL